VGAGAQGRQHRPALLHLEPAGRGGGQAPRSGHSVCSQQRSPAPRRCPWTACPCDCPCRGKRPRLARSIGTYRPLRERPGTRNAALAVCCWVGTGVSPPPPRAARRPTCAATLLLAPLSSSLGCASSAALLPAAADALPSEPCCLTRLRREWGAAEGASTGCGWPGSSPHRHRRQRHVLGEAAKRAGCWGRCGCAAAPASHLIACAILSSGQP
jgi:hypothetical protein